MVHRRRRRPTISITTPEAVYEPKVTVSGTVDDATVSFIDLTVDMQASTRLTIINHAWNTEISLPTAGPNTIRAEAGDLAGNTGFATTTTNYVTVTGLLTVAIDLSEGIPGSTAPICVYTTYERRPIAHGTASTVSSRAFKVFKGLTFDIGSLEGIKTYSLIAAGLSLAAAIAAIAAVFQITRKLVLK